MNEHTLCCGSVADKAKLCAEIEKRDSVIRAQQRRISELLQERDEALAYAERLLDAANNYLYYSDDCSSPSLYSAAKDNLETVLLETPPAALAALKAQWRHDAIMEAVRNTEHVLRIRDGSWLCHVDDITEFAEKQLTQELRNATKTNPQTKL